MGSYCRCDINVSDHFIISSILYISAEDNQQQEEAYNQQHQQQLQQQQQQQRLQVKKILFNESNVRQGSRRVLSFVPYQPFWLDFDMNHMMITTILVGFRFGLLNGEREIEHE